MGWSTIFSSPSTACRSSWDIVRATNCPAEETWRACFSLTPTPSARGKNLWHHTGERTKKEKGIVNDLLKVNIICWTNRLTDLPIVPTYLPTYLPTDRPNKTNQPTHPSIPTHQPHPPNSTQHTQPTHQPTTPRTPPNQPNQTKNKPANSQFLFELLLEK